MTDNELNDYLKTNKKVQKINIPSLSKISTEKNKELIKTYINKFEGILPNTNPSKKVIREYVDQILDKDLDIKIQNFIIKLREIYFKKKEKEPLKAKKRFVVGMKEVEKFLKLEYVKSVFIVPNIEKVCELENKNLNDLPTILDVIDDEDEDILSSISGEEEAPRKVSTTIQELEEKVYEALETQVNPNNLLNIKTVFKSDFKPNNKKSNSIDERLSIILSNCRKSKIPYFFCLNKFKLGKACRKKNSSVSIMAIVNVEGLEPEYNSLVDECWEMKKKFYLENKKEDFLNNKFFDVSEFDKYDKINNKREED